MGKAKRRLAAVPAPPREPIRGTFDPAFLGDLNAITQQLQALTNQRAMLLRAYSQGAGLHGNLRFEWNEKGEYTAVPEADS